MVKKRIIFYAVSIEWLIFLNYCIFAPGGFRDIYTLQKAQQQVIQDVKQIQEKIKHLKVEKEDWKDYPFYKEKIAREQLHMQKEGDEIIIFDEL
ncbi:MAG: septum formation initiator family protein [Candidatus Babeliaceae bacterium]